MSRKSPPNPPNKHKSFFPPSLSLLMKNPLLLFLLLLVAVIAVGDRFMPYGPFVKPPEWPAGAATRQGVVAQPPRESGRVVRMVLRLADTDRLVQLTAVVDSAAASSSAASVLASSDVHVGDLIAFHTRLTPPRNAGNPGEVDYAGYLRHQGITGQGFCFASDWRNLGPASSLTLREQMLTLRSRIVGIYAQHFEGEALALVSAMTLGDRSRIDRSLRELYSRVGASHVLALSGLHLSILCGLLLALFVRPLSRWGRRVRMLGALLVLALLWAFVLLAGLPLSLVRAAMMFSLFLALQQFRRAAPPFHTFILTLTLMLLWNPQQLFDVGLQLSAVAVAAILALGHAERRLRSVADNPSSYLRLFQFRNRFANALPRLAAVMEHRWTLAVLKALLTLFAVSFVAQIATLPLTAHYFGRISLSGFVSSFVVIPMAYCLLFGALLFLLLVPLRGVLASLLTGMLGVVNNLLRHTAAIPVSSFDVHLSWWGVAGSYALLLWLVGSFGYSRFRVNRIERPRLRRAHLLRTVVVGLFIVVATAAGEYVVGVLQRPAPGIAIYNRTDHTEIHLVTPTADTLLTPASPHLEGHVLLYAHQRVAIVSEPLPRISGFQLPPPLPVDVLLLGRGAKGHLVDILSRYRPQLIALDGSLTDYYRRRFAEEAGTLGFPVYDIQEQGALVLEMPQNPEKS